MLFPCPNCGGSIDLGQIEGQEDSKVVYLSDGDLIEPPAAGEEAAPGAWSEQGPLPHGEPRHLSLLRWLAVMLGLIMIIPLIGGYFFLKTTSKKDEAVSCLNSYFTEVDRRNYHAAFRKYMAPDLQRKISLEGYLKEMREIRRKLGKVERRNLMRWSYRAINRGRSCILSYRSLYERGNAEERYALLKTKGGWKIFEFRIEPRPTKSKKGVVKT
jgi:hypothetical protein